MPKIVDYPRASFERALNLAKAVDGLGGSCAVESAADSLGMKVGGGYLSIQSAAVKHGLIDKDGDQLHTTELFKRYKLAYDEQEEREVLTEAFMNVPVYAQVLGRFGGRALPDKFDRVLIREFEVPEKIASRVSKYIVEATKELGLADDSGRLVSSDRQHAQANDDQVPRNQTQRDRPSEKGRSAHANPDTYTVHVVGPGLDMSVQIESEFDIGLVDMLMKRVSRRLQEAENKRDPRIRTVDSDQGERELPEQQDDEGGQE